MIQDELAPLIHEAIVAAQQAGDLPPFDVPPATAIPIERPRLEEHGDFATPIALQLARRARRKPRPMAEAIVTHLPVGPAHMLASAEVAGPGFVNLRLAVPWLVRHVDRVLTAGAHYADPSVGAGRTALVEFVSVNPTGPLTVGHGRGAVIGDTLGNLLEAGGFAVTREYYFNLERNASKYGIAFDPAADVTLLGHPSEVALIHQILRLEETLASCIQRLEPQHLAGYAIELATRFNFFF
jgi:arginyl-tRNA synthetase